MKKKIRPNEFPIKLRLDSSTSLLCMLIYLFNHPNRKVFFSNTDIGYVIKN